MSDLQTLLTWSASARQSRQASGVVLDGLRIETDSESRGVLTAAYVLAKSDPQYTIPNWKVADGVYVTLDASTIIAAGDAVTAFIQRCFDKNREVDDAIFSGDITTREQIVSAFEEMT